MFSHHELTIYATVLTDMLKAELGKTKGGLEAITLDLVVNESWKAKDGSKQERQCYYRAPFYGKAAQTIKNHVGQGDALFIQGTPGDPDAWFDQKTNTLRSRNTIRVLRFRFGQESQKNYAARQAAKANAAAAAPVAAVDLEPEIVAEEVPF
jgi:single-stranded DNA-binding protein